jgi:hypothetical protein
MSNIIEMTYSQSEMGSGNMELDYLESVLTSHPMVGQDFFNCLKTASPSLKERCLIWLRKVLVDSTTVFVAVENNVKTGRQLPRKITGRRMSRGTRKDKRLVSPYNAKGYMKRLRSARKGKRSRRVIPTAL